MNAFVLFVVVCGARKGGLGLVAMIQEVLCCSGVYSRIGAYEIRSALLCSKHPLHCCDCCVCFTMKGDKNRQLGEKGSVSCCSSSISYT